MTHFTEFYADSARGIYTPQYFAETVNRDMVTGVDSEDWAILEAGPDPDNEWYWETWDTVLDNAELTDSDGRTWVLHQDGDLWLIAAESAIEHLNAAIESQVEYETRHGDAGDAYAHCVAESWCKESTRRLIEQLGETVLRGGVNNIDSPSYWDEIPKHNGIDSRWRDIEPDVLADLALESFTMEPGSIWGPYDGGIVLNGFAVDEIEIQLDGLGVDGIALECVQDSLDAYVSGDYAYVTTDSVWYAVLNVEMFNAAIAGELSDGI